MPPEDSNFEKWMTDSRCSLNRSVRIIEKICNGVIKSQKDRIPHSVKFLVAMTELLAKGFESENVDEALRAYHKKVMEAEEELYSSDGADMAYFTFAELFAVLIEEAFSKRSVTVKRPASPAEPASEVSATPILVEPELVHVSGSVHGGEGGSVTGQILVSSYSPTDEKPPKGEFEEGTELEGNWINPINFQNKLMFQEPSTSSDATPNSMFFDDPTDGLADIQMASIASMPLFMNALAPSIEDILPKVRKAGKLKCRDCEKYFASKISLNTHVARFHKTDSPKYAYYHGKPGEVYTCEQCGVQVTSRHKLAVHGLKAHNENSGTYRYANQIPGVEHPCGLCGKKYKTPLLLRCHQRVVHRAKRRNAANAFIDQMMSQQNNDEDDEIGEA